MERIKEEDGPIRLSAKMRVFSEEARPEWTLGPLTAHRLFAILYIGIVSTALVGGVFWLWPEARSARSIIETVWTTGHYLWLAGAPACFMGLAGLLLYRRKPLEVMAVDKTVVFRIVSRGENLEALSRTVNSIKATMDIIPSFPYKVEVVVEEMFFSTDVIPLALQAANVDLIVVPKDYRLESGTKFKAKALHYAMLHTNHADDVWIVHLDEESNISKSFVMGVAKAIAEEEESGRLRIGQGQILYHRLWDKHRFWTLLDCGRTGQDLGPFYLQALLGISLYGFHGSFILIRNDVEKATGGFDLGLAGSETEDAWWILIANHRGYKIRWVEGFLEEQSVQGFSDFMDQRGRWFHGLLQVVRRAPVPVWRRVPLGLSLLLWMVVWLSVPYSMAHAFLGFQPPTIVLAVAATSWASYACMSVLGLLVNLKNKGDVGFVKGLFLVALQTFLVPLYCVMEMLAAFWRGVVRPKGGFHVIKK